MGKTILIVGDVMLDEYIWGEVERISPEAPVPVVRVKNETWVPGGAANVAHNISSLGGSPVIAGVIGDDSAGRRLSALLLKNGIDARRTHRTGRADFLLETHFEQGLLSISRPDGDPRRYNPVLPTPSSPSNQVVENALPIISNRNRHFFRSRHRRFCRR